MKWQDFACQIPQGSSEVLRGAGAGGFLSDVVDFVSSFGTGSFFEGIDGGGTTVGAVDAEGIAEAEGGGGDTGTGATRGETTETVADAKAESNGAAEASACGATVNVRRHRTIAVNPMAMTTNQEAKIIASVRRR